MSFPENTAYDATGVDWVRDRSTWTCKGTVLQVNGTGRIDIFYGLITNDGEVQDFVANVSN